jgi:hypothetical protein
MRENRVFAYWFQNKSFKVLLNERAFEDINIQCMQMWNHPIRNDKEFIIQLTRVRKTSGR